MRFVLVVLATLFAAPLRAETVLVMVEQAGCAYCAEWDAVIAPIYPKTAESRAAPLVRVDLHDLPPDMAFARPPVFTPTFVLMRDGVELSRIEGYPGEDFFWGLLGQMLEAAGPDATGAEG